MREKQVQLLLRGDPPILEGNDSSVSTHNHSRFSRSFRDHLVGSQHDLILFSGVRDPVDVGKRLRGQLSVPFSHSHDSPARLPQPLRNPQVAETPIEKEAPAHGMRLGSQSEIGDDETGNVPIQRDVVDRLARLDTGNDV